MITELSVSPEWSPSALMALERRWAYAIALQVGAYEDRWKEGLVQQNEDLQRAIDERDQRILEVAGLNKILQQMLSGIHLERAEELQASEVVRTIGRLVDS